MTKVVFRKFKEGDIIALFPEIEEGFGRTMSYQHLGQHGSAYYWRVINITTSATPEEYKPLYDELVSIGYNDLTVIKKYTKR